MIYEKAYAKINLALEVGKTIDSYHEVQNLMVPISLYDEVFLEKAPLDSLECERPIDNNICLKALRLFKEKYNIESGVHIILHKNIPVMAGLAGGSTDAAATLRGLNRLFDVKATNEELCLIAKELGSDVPFFLYNKIAMCTGRGEEVTPLDLEFKDVPFLLIKPKYSLSTKDVYDKYIYDGVSKNALVKQIYRSIEKKDLDSLDKLIFNDLENVALSLNSNLKDLFAKIDSLSYIPHISGSGPTIFILNAKAIDKENIKALDPSLELILCHSI